VTEARDWIEGVYMAATMGSETTAAAAGKQGVVRRDPFAMLPFAGYNMAEYFGHWLKLGDRLVASGAELPKIFTVNWFRKDADGRFVWPGFGDNLRVLAWMLERVEGRGGGEEHLFGITPRYQDIHWHGLDFSEAQYRSVTSIDRAAWADEMKLHEDLFERLAHKLPPELLSAKAAIEESVRRIRSIALVHETLSREDGDDVDFGEVVRSLVRMVEEGLTSPDTPVELVIEGGAGKLPSPEATSLAVVITELLQNVVDHAFRPGTLNPGERGRIRIVMAHDQVVLRLAVIDDGAGFPDDFDPETSDSLGLSIVRGLIDELGGTMEFTAVRPGERRPGNRVQLTLPVVSRVEADAQRPPPGGGRSVGLYLWRGRVRRPGPACAGPRPRRGAACGALLRRCHPRRRSPGWSTGRTAGTAPWPRRCRRPPWPPRSARAPGPWFRPGRTATGRCRCRPRRLASRRSPGSGCGSRSVPRCPPSMIPGACFDSPQCVGVRRMSVSRRSPTWCRMADGAPCRNL